jgi:hypothetical protein
MILESLVHMSITIVFNLSAFSNGTTDSVVSEVQTEAIIQGKVAVPQLSRCLCFVFYMKLCFLILKSRNTSCSIIAMCAILLAEPEADLGPDDPGRLLGL